MRKTLYSVLFSVAMVMASVVAVTAQTSPSSTGFPGIHIKNFGQMDTNYYRGAQPQQEDFAALKALGVTTVIDLQKDPKDFEKTAVEALGMKYINIPMDDQEYPSDSTIAAFLKDVEDPTNGVVFVHCKGGRHRTGITGAAYRISKDGWNYDKTMTEMKNYNFDTSYGRDALEKFVKDYAAKAHQTAAAAKAVTVP